MMKKRKVLFVDDELDLVKAMQIRLENANFEFITANNGQEGLEKARHENPDLIILDLMLPKLNGYKVCRMLKCDDKYKEIPIIMYTAQTQQENEELGYEVGADAFLSKFIDFDILLNKIDKLFQGGIRAVEPV